MKPPFRWVGGKTRLLGDIAEFMPDDGKVRINNYFEPFVGGGAVFFDWASTAAKHCFLNDSCRPLMVTYEQLRDNFAGVRAIARELEHIQFNRLRELFNVEKMRTTLDAPRLAALFIFMNFLAFNGVYRENKKGGFNAPQGGTGSGSKKKPYTADRITWDVLERAGAALQRATLTCTSFDPWPFDVQPGLDDVVFYDPPYLGEFSDYSAGRFGAEDHLALRRQAQACAAAGATVIVCGSNNEASHRIYGKPTRVISLPRNVGNSLRGDATEALYVFSKVG